MKPLCIVLLIFLPATAQPGTGPDAVPEFERPHVPLNLFAGQPRGPYQTGTVEEMWVDAQRQETTTSDPHDKRRLMIQIWYPASFAGDPPRALYALHGELYSRELGLRAENPKAQWVYGGWLDDVAVGFVA